MKKNYEWRDGARFTNIDANKAGSELDRIYKKHGILQPETVVDESRKEVAPLHPAFEWDDSKAAEEYRCNQARNIIRAIKVVDVEGEEKRPVFIHVNATDKESDSGYHPAEVVVKSTDLFTSALEELLSKLSAAQKAVEDLKCLSGGKKDGVKSLILVAGQGMSAAITALESIKKAA